MGTAAPGAPGANGCEEVIDLVGAGEYASRPIGRLSGGEQQRLLIAQALISRPKVLILDEPLDSLDLPNQTAVAALLARICREQGVSVLLVAHDVNPLLTYLDRVVYFGAGHAAVGTPREVITAETLMASTGCRSRYFRPPTGGSSWSAFPRRPRITATATSMIMASHLPLAVLSVDLISDFRQLTAYPFMVNALEAGTIVAVMAGVVGWFMVLRRETFAGHTLSVMAFPGATFALLLGLSAAVGYYTFCGACALVIGAAAGTRRHRGEESAVTGTVQAFGLACGFLFLSLYQGVLAGYENLLFGDFLGVTRGQVLTLAIVCVVALAFFAVLGRPLLFASVDQPVARAVASPSAGFLAFMLALGLTVAATAQITGALLVFALLVAPPRPRS